MTKLENPSECHSVLEVCDLVFSYPRQSQRIFENFSHSFKPGLLTALTGESGRGKSTLLYILGLMLKPDTGLVLIDGSETSTLTDKQRSVIRATRIGFVFQDSELDPTRSIIDSVVEPGLYAGHNIETLRRKAMVLLEKFGLAERALHRPGQISGGQAQRVAVCRALVNSPAIVLADEPTGNLDPDNATLVIDALSDAAHEGCTVVIATHDPTVIEKTDEVVGL